MDYYQRKEKLNHLISGSLQLLEAGRKDEVQMAVLVRAAQSVGFEQKNVIKIITEGYPSLRIINNETIIRIEGGNHEGSLESNETE